MPKEFRIKSPCYTKNYAAPIPRLSDVEAALEFRSAMGSYASISEHGGNKDDVEEYEKDFVLVWRISSGVLFLFVDDMSP